MSAEALLGAKRRKTRAHKPLTGEYAEHFDHVAVARAKGARPSPCGRRMSGST